MACPAWCPSRLRLRGHEVVQELTLRRQTWHSVSESRHPCCKPSCVGHSVNAMQRAEASFPSASRLRSRVDMRNLVGRCDVGPSQDGRPRAKRVGKRRLAWLVGGLVLGASLSQTAQVEAAKIRGKVVGFKFLRNPVWVEAQDPSRHLFSFREAVPTVPSSVRQLYPHIPKEICLVALAAAAQKAPPPVLIRVGGGRTTPVTIVVPPMTQLSFQNTDPFPHRLYGVGIGTFPPSDTMRGGNRDWTVPAPGSYEIRDESAPSLRMWIIAEPNVAAIAYPSLKGEFGLNINEPGEYTIQAYFAGKATGPATVVKIDTADVEMKTPVVLAKAAEKKEADKSGADKGDDDKAEDDKAEGDKAKAAEDKAAEDKAKEK
jgi:hypothetical protein